MPSVAVMQTSALQPGSRAGCPDQGTPDEFWARFGDVIDDRVAELLDDLLDEREAARPPRPRGRRLAVFGVAIAVAVLASIALRRSEIAVCAVWALLGAASLATTLLAGRRA
ncbi:MAG TPA: hypothetical protein VFV41_20190 [Streptosporangiaceae bacterium]|nr:hypothetical protein [Streptosporangiaceae bacterium]